MSDKLLFWAERATEFEEENKRLEQRINLLQIAGDEAIKQRNDALRERDELWKGAKTMNLRPEVQKFAEEMEKQLRANEHKGGWRNCTICHLIVELRRNSYELERAALRVDAGLTSSIPSVVRRAANVANFAMMVADNWGGEFLQKKPEPEELVEDCPEDWDEEGEHDD